MRCNERQQRHVARTLDRHRQRTLMARADTSAAARQDLAALGHAALQTLNILIVYDTNLIRAEHADLASGAKATASRADAATSLILSHNKPRLLY
jgi:hypothetical protein